MVMTATTSKQQQAETSTGHTFSSLGPGDKSEPYTYARHPWKEDIKMPAGMLCPQANRVAARPLTLAQVGRIKLPEDSAKSAGWFVIGEPGNPEDLDERYSQEMTVESTSPEGTEIITHLGPGDIVAASDFQCWPIDVVYDRWRLVGAVDVVMVIKRGSKLWFEMTEQYRPFRTEKDPDIGV